VELFQDVFLSTIIKARKTDMISP